MSDLPYLFKLDCPVQDYHWGSPDFIQNLTGREVTGEPAAELWMGGHPRASSVLRSAGELDGQPLSEVIAAQPEEWLGPEWAEKFAYLPFLFKVLAADKSLSIQCHPDKGAAAAGFARENQDGPALNSPQRNYKDDNHKPELLVALGKGFTILKGFRPREEIEINLRNYRLVQLADEFSQAKEPYRFIVERILTAKHDETSIWLALTLHWAKKILSEPTLAMSSGQASMPGKHNINRVMLPHWLFELQRQYPNDGGCLMPLILNLYKLREEESVYLGPGELHAYLKGTGLEIMANSDNVLRGGLTTKHIDPPELLNLLKAGAQPVNPMVPEKGKGMWLHYPQVAREFQLSRFLGTDAEEWVETSPGPSIFFALDGEFQIRCQSTRLQINQGEAVFQRYSLPSNRVELSGRGHLYRASVGSDGKE